jgi:hypothetical protein
MSIGHWPWSHVNTTPLNSLGLPGDELVNVLPKGQCKHVVFAGDSFTFGDGVDWEDSYFMRLSRLSARRNPDRCIRFFNVAERMTTIEQQLDRVRETWHLIEPDAIVLGQYQNDLSDLTNPGSIGHQENVGAVQHDNQWGNVLRRVVPGYDISLIRFLTYRVFAALIRNDVAYDTPLGTWSVLESGRESGQADRLKAFYRDFYEEIVEEVRSRDAEFAAVIFPSKLDLLAQRYPEGEFYRQLAGEFEVPHISMYSVLDSVRAGYPYHMYDGHLNEYGNAVVAVRLVEWLFDDSPAPLPTLREP